MTLQGTHLVMSGLSVLADNPPNLLQPPLKDGIHLRWEFPPERGFPWHGFYLFRRRHHRQDPARIKDELQGFSPGPQGTKTITTQLSQISSDVDLFLTDHYPPGAPDGKPELNLSGRSYLRIDLGAGSLASELSAHLFSVGSNETTIQVRLFFEHMSTWIENIVIPAGAEANFQWKFNGIKGIEFGSGPLLLVDLGIVRIGQGPNVGWMKTPDFPYPLNLPLTRPDYPATAGIAEDLKAARATARDRIDHGGYSDPDHFAPAPTAVYSQGSIDLSQGSSLARGNGTGWTTNMVGCLLQVTGEKTAYTITTVLAADRLVLSRKYNGTTTSGLGYEISQDPFGQLHDLLVHLTRDGNAANPLPMNDRWLPESIYEQGTIDATQNSEKIGGLGTTWDDMLEGAILEIETKIGPSVHHIVKVTSSTQLLIDPPYPGSSASGLHYRILPPLTPENLADSGLEAVRQKPLDLLLLGALHPAVAQMLGLYWVDQAVNQVDAYDYLIVAAHKDVTGGSSDPGQGFLDWLQSDPAGLDDPEIDAYIVYDQEIGTPTPLSKPDGLAVYALPTASYNAPGAAGLRWDLGEYERHTLLPGKPVLYHILRADLGGVEPAARPGASAYSLITADRPVLVLHSDPPGKELPRRNDWPPTRLHYLDQGRAEGWYSYQICGVDIFGRYSPNSDPAPWHEWSPAPDRPPWYWGRPTAPVVHPFAVALLDKMPPPPPIGVEAIALDPADPFLVKDDAYTAWWNNLTASTWYQNLSEEARKRLIGLRVRWLWTESEAVQAPDTSEFRVYFQPGPWNAVLGRITAVAPVANQVDRSTVTVQTGAPNTRGLDAYQGASLRLGADAFPILASSAGDPLVLTVTSGPVVTAGTAKVQDGSPTIIGTKGTNGTGWTKALVGLTFQVDGEQISYRILKLDEAAQEITLDAPYHGLSGNKSYTIAGKLPRAGQPCSVVIPKELAAEFADYQHPTAWAQRLAAVDFDDHVAPVLQPARDRNGVALCGKEAAVSGSVVTLIDPPPDADFANLDLADRVRTLCLTLANATNPAKLYRVLAVDPKGKTVALDGAPALTTSPSPWLLGYPARRYEIFLPDPSHAQPAGLPLAPSLAEPILYGSIGVSAADDKAHTPDHTKWQGTPWGDRPGNEGQVSAPATVFCVLRRSPDPPAISVFDSDKVFATRADYHSHSFYTVRWMPADHLKVHVFRALDETVYAADWLIRVSRTALDPNDARFVDLFLFPDIDIPAAKKQTIAAQLNGIASKTDYGSLSDNAKRVLARLPGNAGVGDWDGLVKRDWAIRKSRTALSESKPDDPDEDYFPPEWRPNPDTPAMLAKRSSIAAALSAISSQTGYAALGKDALRVLANLPGNERAFVQITVEPLDPDAPETANARSPDDPDEFTLDDLAHPGWSSKLRRFVDTLDGRSSNAYFYRVMAVDGAHNRSALSLSTPPVYCPGVTPPGKPQVLKALGGERQVKLHWEAGPGPTPDLYQVFRTIDRDLGRDIRLMGTPVVSLPAQPLTVTRAEIDVSAISGIVKVERVYAAAGFDPEKDLLTGQNTVQYLPAPVAVVRNRITGINSPSGAQVVLVYWDNMQTLQYTPSGAAPLVWVDGGLTGAMNYFYRVLALRVGETGVGPKMLSSEPSSLSAARAYDLVPPQPPTITLIEWVRVDEAGTVFPYSQPIPAGQTRFTAVRLRWSSPDPQLRCLVQSRTDSTGNFENASGWLSPGVYEWIPRNEYDYVTLEYRLKVVNSAGNANITFLPATIAPQP